MGFRGLGFNLYSGFPKLGDLFGSVSFWGCTIITLVVLRALWCVPLLAETTACIYRTTYIYIYTLYIYVVHTYNIYIHTYVYVYVNIDIYIYIYM